MPTTDQRYNALAYSSILENISSSATEINLPLGGANAFSLAFDANTEVWATLTDVLGDIEVIKITNIEGDKLTVERGQDVPIAKAWLAGSVITQRLAASNFLQFEQKTVFRTIAFNPNGAMTASYPGEKVRQIGLDACDNRWWKNVDTTRWALIAGDPCPDEKWDNGFLQPPAIMPFYLVGGEEAPGNVDLDQNDGYDPPFDFWETKQPAIHARDNAGGSESGAFGYFLAGVSGVTEKRDNQEYEAEEDSWAAKTSVPLPNRTQCEASAISDKVYLIAGWDGVYLSDNDEYDRSGNSWASRANISPARRWHQMTEIGSAIYLWGGRSPAYVFDNDEYVVDSWTARTSLTLQRYYGAATKMNGKGYNFYGFIFGGGETNDCIEYTPPPTDSWANKTDGPAPDRGWLIAGSYEDLGYAIAGRWAIFEEFLADNDEYNPSTNSWTSKLPILSPARRFPTIMQPTAE